MDYETKDIVDAFKSARLQYIRADQSDHGLRAFLPQIEQDPVIQAMAAPTMLQPKGKKAFDSYLESLVNSLLGVAICLLPGEDKNVNPERDSSNAEQENSTIIGIMCIGWGGIPPSVAHHRTADIGISLARPYQNRGYGREAINWMLDWGFRHAALHSIGITTASYNPKAAHLYESMGFKLEGRRRGTIWQNRKWYDLLEFGMVEEEWEKLRGITS
ncbi:hypothetical protein ACHAPT_006845 [Fusarium lateritium]